MNLADYQRELHDAHREFRDALQTAADTLSKRTAVAQEKFFGETEKAVMAEENAVPARYRDRD